MKGSRSEARKIVSHKRPLAPAPPDLPDTLGASDLAPLDLKALPSSSH